MLNYEPTRLLTPHERYVFDRAVDSNNTILQASLLMDGQIVDAQNNARYQACSEIPNFTDEITDLTSQAHYALAESDRRGRESWTDYYRLIGQTAFLEQRLKAPLVFEKPTYWKERQQLVNGIYGVSAHLIRETLDEFDHAHAHPDEQVQLWGVLQEQTFPALFNRPEQRNRIALPSATLADLHRKIDVEVWTMHDKQAEPFYLPVQIKSSLHSEDEEYVTPMNGITIVAHEFKNSHNLAVSRLIAREHDYMSGAGEPLTERQEKLLDSARTKLIDTIEYKAQHTI